MGKHFERGMALYELHRYGEAVEEFTKELAEEPESPIAFAMRGASLINLGNNRHADNDIRAAIAIAPEFAYSYYLLSISLMNRGRRRAAEKAIREALRLAPCATFFHQLGMVFYNAERYGDCLEATKSALALDPHDESSLILRAKALTKSGQAGEARELLQKALVVHAENPETHRELGTVILQIGQAADALNHLLEARRIDPIHHNDRLSLAAAYGRLFWPLNKIDSFLIWMQGLTIGKRWLLVNGTSTALFCTLLVTQPDENRFSIVAALAFVFIANVITLLGTLEWIARIAAISRLRRALGLRWSDYFAGVFDVVGIALAHGLATVGAGMLTMFPAVYFFILSMVVLCWDSFELLGRISCLLGVLLGPILGFLFLVLSAGGAISMIDRPQHVVSYWSACIAISVVAVLIRLKTESSGIGDLEPNSLSP